MDMEQKNIFLWSIPVAVALLAVIGYSVLVGRTASTPEGGVSAATSSPVDISFSFSGRTVTLVGGYAEAPAAPGSAAKEVFRAWSTPVMVDLDGDQDEDAIYYVTQDTGGSGTFFFVVVAVNDAGVYSGTNALYLGDRIAPQNITIDRGVPVANFAERKAGEPFTTRPSVGKSVWIHLNAQTREIGEAVQNFEGEADTARMTLPMQAWTWVRSEGEGVTVTPKQEGRFTITFKEDQSVSVTTDCNGMGGTYTTKGSTLTFGPMMSTLMYCEGSQEGEFGAMLGKVHGYAFTGKGELQLSYGTSGMATFR